MITPADVVFLYFMFMAIREGAYAMKCWADRAHDKSELEFAKAEFMEMVGEMSEGQLIRMYDHPAMTDRHKMMLALAEVGICQ